MALVDLAELVTLSDADLHAQVQAKGPEWLDRILATMLLGLEQDRQTIALAHFTVVNPMALPVHLSTAREVAIVGGNRSSKTETALVELIIAATGHVPQSLWGMYPMHKLQPPIRARVVCNSLTNTLEPVIKPKLRWDAWSGEGDSTDGRGHWGWIPRRCLPGGTWDGAYSEKYRTLRVAVDTEWRGPNGERWRPGVSTIQFMSYDQSPSEFSGSSLHVVFNDELPPADLYRENKMRTMDVQGRILTAFTPPDEAGANRADVTWFYDQVYEKGLPGTGKDPDIDTFVLWTEKNNLLSLEAIRKVTANLSEDQKQARLYGAFLHLSGVVYPLFTATPKTWCFKCLKTARVDSHGWCDTCHGSDVEPYCHVIPPFEVPRSWPLVFVIDPHPRKADAMGWFAIAPNDDVYLVAEHEGEGQASDVVRQVREIEAARTFLVVQRLMDPNIATQGNERLEHGWTLRTAYDQAGLRCALANDSIPVGIQHVTDALRPDPATRQPRFHVFSSCPKFIYGMTHWAWEEWGRSGDREPKEIVRDRFKDFPDLARYLFNDLPTFGKYARIGQAMPRRTPPKRGY